MKNIVILLFTILVPLFASAKSWGKDSTEIKTKLAAFAKKYRLKDDIRIKLERSLIEETYKEINLNERKEKSKLPNGEMYVYPFTEEDSLLLTSFSAIGVSEQEIFERIEKEKKIVRKKNCEPSLIKEGMRNDRYYRFQRREILDDPKLESLLIEHFSTAVYYDKRKLKQKSTSKK